MIKQQLVGDLKKAVEDLGLPADRQVFKTIDIVCDIPQNSSFGDYTSNIALQLAKQKSEKGKQTSQEIANKILENLRTLPYLDKIEVAGPGFINFYIKDEILVKSLEVILKEGEDFGKSDFGKGKKIQVEYISANPTGPLTLANGRGGSLGDTLANVLSWNGFEVNREYYVNDTGNQIRILGESVLSAAGKIESKEEHYQGEYIKELAVKFVDKLDLESQELGYILADYLMDHEIKPAIKKMGIKFDEYYSERSLHERDLIQKTVKLLEEKGLSYKKDGAVWFKSSQFGDEKDRVLMTSVDVRGRAEPTYLLPDIIHHLEMFKRGYVKRINFLGADHHSYVVRLKLSVEAITKTEWLDFVLFQMVKLIKNGQEVRMSKRAGTYVALDELLQTIGKDEIRFFFLMYDMHTHMNFDLDLAKEKSQKNPVYYVKYAHARMSNILNKADVGSQASLGVAKLNHLELSLIKHLVQFPDLIAEIAETYHVHKLTAYVIKLADLFHKFYESCRVLNAETDDLKKSRLALVSACKIVLGNTLKIMGIEAPERM